MPYIQQTIMKKFFLFILLIALLFITGCAQRQYGYQKGLFYFKQKHPGNIMVDDNGQPINSTDTIQFIYVEVKGTNEPAIEEVMHNGKSYAAAVFSASPSEFQIGIRKLDGKKEVLQPKEGNKIWKLELTPLENKTTIKNNGPTIIKGKLAGKPFLWRIHQTIELAADETY
jgi:hypothetical protein